MNYKRIYTYPIDLYLWVHDARLAVLCFLMLTLAGIVSVYTYPTAQTIKISGYILQLMGMVFAIRGVLNIRSHFGHPPLKSLVIIWLQKFPKWKKHATISIKPSTISIKTSWAILDSWTKDNPEESIEKRIGAILTNIDSLKATQQESSKQIVPIKENYKTQIELQKQTISNVQEKLSSDLEVVHTSDILVSLVGLVWLTVGITMGTLPIEIHTLIK